MNCPCGGGPALADCCGRYHAGQPAPTAEALMRSRYSAFALGLVDYLLETHDPETRGGVNAVKLSDSMRGTRWVGLEILGTRDGGPDDDTGEVEFIATFRDLGGPPSQMRERSTFRRLPAPASGAGRWAYVGAVKPAPVRRSAPKVRPNDPCPCGSGRKHKRCCG